MADSYERIRELLEKRDRLASALRELETGPQPAEVTYQNGWAVPAGWKLVPKKPTYELECEVGGVRMDEEFFLHEYADHEKIGEICRAVVKYSPPPPKAPDYNPGPLEVSVIGMPEFDALLDHIYEEGTGSEGVVHLANKLVRAAIQSHMSYARNAQPVAYQWAGVLIRAEESHPVHRKEGQPLYAYPIPSAPAVPDGLTPRHWRLIDFALWRLINDAYSKANFAAQAKDRLHWKPEHVGKFLQDAEDAGAARRIVMKAIEDNGWTAAPSPTEKKEG